MLGPMPSDNEVGLGSLGRDYGEVLWQPGPAEVERARITGYRRWLASDRGVTLPGDTGAGGYRELHAWSVADPGAFWGSLWDYFDVLGERGDGPVLTGGPMPDVSWFPGATLNYAQNALRVAATDPARIAVIARDEAGNQSALTYGELAAEVARVRAALHALGVARGDRVAAYLPNIPAAIIGLLATASLGAVWSSCSPDFGPASVIDRFAQITPKVLLAVDGYRYGGKDFDRRPVLRQLLESLPTVEHTVVLGYLDPDPSLDGLGDALSWEELRRLGEGAPLRFEHVPFDHPLWVLYSSGTTGLQKAIVHGHGGILVEMLKKMHLHVDLHADDRLFWFTTTGWMMSNFVVSALTSDASVVLYDGNPGTPDLNVLWDLAEAAGITCFGTSAAFIANCQKAGIRASEGRDL